MNPMIQKLVDSEFMTEAHGIYLEEAIARKESLIVSGHKGWGILPLLATFGAVAKTSNVVKQVKSLEDLKEVADYFLIVDAKDVEFGTLIGEAMAVSGTQMIAIKDPDHPYSFYKLLGDVYKINADTSKVYHVIECAKINDEKKLSKITRVTVNEKGKAIKVDF